MSYKYGLNGNDLNWDEVLTLNEFCVECSENLHELEKDLYNTLKQHGFDNDFTRDIIDQCVEEYNYHRECEGHTHCYFAKTDEEYTTEDIIKAGGIEKLADYGLFHDTNGNFVSTFGNVPDRFFTEEYIKERDEAEC